MPSQQIAYLTVISWPESFSESARIEALVNSAAMDPYQAKLACRRNLPGIMCSIDANVREHITNALLNTGVLCIAPTQAQIDQYPQAQLAQSIQQFPDASQPRFVVETQTGEHWTFSASDVKLVIAGSLKNSTAEVKKNRFASTPYTSPERAIVQSLTGESVYLDRHTKLTQMLDLHIMVESQLRLVRLVGPRTRIGIVGDNARPSLLDDSQPNEMIQILMPDAHIDMEFHDFDPPHTVRKQASKRSKRGGTLTIEAWAFYSPWVGLMRQAIYGW